MLATKQALCSYTHAKLSDFEYGPGYTRAKRLWPLGCVARRAGRCCVSTSQASDRVRGRGRTADLLASGRGHTAAAASCDFREKEGCRGVVPGWPMGPCMIWGNDFCGACL